MSTLSLISLSIKDATNKASEEAFGNVTNSFSIEINRQVNPGTPRGGGNVKGQDIKKISENENIPGTVCFIYHCRFGAHSNAFNCCICHEERTLVYCKRWIVYRQRDRLFARYIKPRIFNQPAGHKNRKH